MSFYTPEAFYLLLLVLVFIFFKQKETGNIPAFSKEMYEKIVIGSYAKNKSSTYLLLGFIFMVLAMSRPVYLKNENRTLNSNVDMVVALDISSSMMCEDIYPSRYEFAKNKISSMIGMMDGHRVVLLGFSNQPFIITPLTDNYEILNYLLTHMNLDNINQKGTDIFKLLKATDQLLSQNEKKALVIFTDGSENKSFENEIKYANEKNISVFVYNIGTKQGGAISQKGDLIKDQMGNIVITSINEEIRTLASSTGGKYMDYSFDKEDIKQFLKTIKEKFASQGFGDKLSLDKTELFFIPLLLAFICFIISKMRLRG